MSPISEQKKSLKGGEGLDYAIMNFVQQNLHTAFTDVFFPIVTMLGNHGLVWLCLIAALLLTKKYRRCGGMLLLTLAATFLLGEFILKPIIARPRPFVDNPNVLLLIPPAKRLFLPIQPFFFLLCCGNHAVFLPQKGWNCGSCIGFSDCFQPYFSVRPLPDRCDLRRNTWNFMFGIALQRKPGLAA